MPLSFSKLKKWSSYDLLYVVTSEALHKMEGTKKIKSTSLHQYSWNFEVETTWISFIGWHHKTSITYLHNIAERHFAPNDHSQYFEQPRSIMLQKCRKTFHVFCHTSFNDFFSCILGLMVRAHFHPLLRFLPKNKM